MESGMIVKSDISYEIESISNDQKLFYRVHKTYIDEDIDDEKKKIRPAAFDPQPKNKGSVEMSVNWEKYITAQLTKESHRKPDMIGVVSFITGVVRSEPVNLKVTHVPTANRAHSHIHDVLSNLDDPEIRVRLRDICNWEIKF